jgi:hypothetical protein
MKDLRMGSIAKGIAYLVATIIVILNVKLLVEVLRIGG